MLKIFALLVLLTNLLAFVSGTAEAQNWPTRPIKFVVPYGPGIGIDIMARMIADRLSRRLGHAVIVENQPGAGSTIGTQYVARAEPDGYTFLFTGNSPLTSNIYLFKSLPYDPRRAFDAVAMVADRGPFVISANQNLPVKSLTELIEYAKARPGQLNYAYDSSSAYNWVVGQYLNRSARFPGSEQLPTFDETLPGFRLEGFIPLMAPAGLPVEIAQRLNKEMGEVLQDQEVLQRITSFGYATSGAETPDAVNQRLRVDREMWSTFAKELSIQPQ